jgi:hypothetical protein
MKSAIQRLKKAKRISYFEFGIPLPVRKYMNELDFEKRSKSLPSTMPPRLNQASGSRRGLCGPG